MSPPEDPNIETPGMPRGRIRPIAICIVRRGEELLVFEAHDSSKNETFYRPLGGGIEFGEYGHQAVRREIREELAVELVDLRYLGVLENIFTFESRACHELVFVYEARLADANAYAVDELAGYEDSGAPFKVVWAPLFQFRSGAAPLYPDGLLALLDSQ